jgi:hypothetical protein
MGYRDGVGRMKTWQGWLALAAFALLTGASTGIAYLYVPQSWTASQRAAQGNASDSSGTWTPNFDTYQHLVFSLVHGETCVIANPATTPVAGQTGTFTFIQSSSGSDSCTFSGSDYTYAGGVASISLSTGANAVDLLSYKVRDSTHIQLVTGGLNFTH